MGAGFYINDNARAKWILILSFLNLVCVIYFCLNIAKRKLAQCDESWNLGVGPS